MIYPSGYLYMVRALAGPRKWLVKIGWTRCPKQRFREICQSHDVRGPIDVLYVRWSDTSLVERWAHRFFAREARGGEWFALSRRQMARYAHRPSDYPRGVVESRACPKRSSVYRANLSASRKVLSHGA